MLDGCVGASGGGCDGEEIARERFDLITVAHPCREGLRNSAEELVIGAICHDTWCTAKFAGVGRQDTTAEGMAGDLHAIANSEDGYTELEDGWIDGWGTGGIDTGRAA